MLWHAKMDNSGDILGWFFFFAFSLCSVNKDGVLFFFKKTEFFIFLDIYLLFKFREELVYPVFVDWHKTDLNFKKTTELKRKRKNEGKEVFFLKFW